MFTPSSAASLRAVSSLERRGVHLGRQPELFGQRELKALRHHPNDGPRDRIDKNRPPQYVGCAVEPVQPQVVAQDDHLLGAWQLFSLDECAAK